MGPIRLLVVITVLVITSVSSWIVAVRMRRRMRKSLGRDATDAELVSLKTWMEVDEVEKREQQARPMHPR